MVQSLGFRVLLLNLKNGFQKLRLCVYGLGVEVVM